MATLPAPDGGYRDLPRTVDRRYQLVGLAAILAVAAEILTPLPGLLLGFAVAVIVGPAVLFVWFWRLLGWLRDDALVDALANRHRPAWPGRRRLWVAFLAAWGADLAATVTFFLLPSLYEKNPVTVALYQAGGIPGALLAGVCYAALVALVVRALPGPDDVDFLAGATLLYGVFVLHNAILVFGVGL